MPDGVRLVVNCTTHAFHGRAVEGGFSTSVAHVCRNAFDHDHLTVDAEDLVNPLFVERRVPAYITP